jgi:hypothetical protein
MNSQTSTAGLLVILSWSLGIVRADITSDLVAYYPFSGNANDASGNGWNGAVNNATLTSDRLGTALAAYQFAADVNSRIIVPGTSALNFSDQLTVSCWVKFNEPWFYHKESLVYKFDQDNTRGWHLGVDQNDGAYGNGNYAIQFDVPDGGALIPMPQAIVPFSVLNSWNNIAGVFDHGLLKLYLNGVFVDSVAGGSTIFTTDKEFVIGGSVHPVSGAYNRDIDEVRIYNRALNGQEILELVPEPSVAWLMLGAGLCLLRKRTNKASPFCGAPVMRRTGARLSRQLSYRRGRIAAPIAEHLA